MDNKKTLYISDLDGTLLNSNAAISDYTAQMLNKFISDGGFFSVATARTAATAISMVRCININVPVILMNGVCIYDTQNNVYVKIEKISDEICSQMLDVIREFSLSGFLFSITDSVLDTYYENINSPNAAKFVEERTNKFGKVFTKVDNFKNCIGRGIIYYSVTDRYELLEPLYLKLKKVKGIHIDFYRDVYDENYWYLEISSDKASKYNAVMYLRKEYKFDRIIGFGDNFNDIPMFDACDEAYAVENGKDEVKKKSDGVIFSNNNDGVVKKIYSLY